MYFPILLLFSFCVNIQAFVPTCSEQDGKCYSNPLTEDDKFSKLFDDSLFETSAPVPLSTIYASPIPSYLAGGVLIKNGPGIFGMPKTQGNPSPQRYSHVFDGLAKLTKYEFLPSESDSQTIQFSTQFIKSNMFKSVTDPNKQRLPPTIVAGSPSFCPAIF
jgi:hypothetical protein